MALIRQWLRKHIEPRFYSFLWIFAFGLGFSIAFMSVRNYSAFEREISLCALLLGVSLATIGWIWNGRAMLDMSRRTNAMSALHNLGSPEVHEWKDKIYPYIREYDEWKNSTDGEARQKPEMPHVEIQKLLGVYEQMSTLIRQGVLDEEIIRESQYLVYRRLYEGLRHHIDNSQKKNPDYFSHFEGMSLKWNPDLQRHPLKPSDRGVLFDPFKNIDEK